MKTVSTLLFASTLLLASCQNAPKADKAEGTDAQQVTATAATHKADLTQSKVEFIGTKPIGKHHGIIMLKDGELTVSGDEVTGGTFNLDMPSLKTDDQSDTAMNAKLTGHLKSGDFFNVDSFKTSTFAITSVTKGADSASIMKDATHTVTGNLTIKGITKSITFPAKIASNGTTVTADAAFNIDRTQWNLLYNNDKGLGDKFIYPEVNLTLHLVANKL